MAEISSLRCNNHPDREAVARCPECRLSYCRECVTEHEDRVLCAACLGRLTGVHRVGARRTGLVVWTIRCIAGFLLAWSFFYLVGRVVLLLPSSFHEGHVWR
jgi:hypothetical protein